MNFQFQKTCHLFHWFSYLSFSRIVNFVRFLFAYSFTFLGLNRTVKLSPFFISVEPADFCNLQCPECPVGLKNSISTERKGNFFDLDLYRNLIEELKETLLHVQFYFQGEPFLNNQLTEMIHFAHERKLFTSVSTNGQFLTEKTARNVVQSGLDKLIVSVDGTTQEVYEMYRKGGNLQKVFDGINKVLVWKKQLKSFTPMIEIQFLVLKSNEHQMGEMKQITKMMKVDKLSFKSAQFCDFENGNSQIPENSRYARYRLTECGKFELKFSQPNRCSRLLGGAVINTRGEVLPCCYDKKSEYSFGNIRMATFHACWHSDKANSFRKQLLLNRSQFDICRNCTGK